MNLVVNARDAMPQGGDITVRTENLHLSEAMTRDQVTLPKGDYVRIIVRDHGCGIAPDHLGKIFERSSPPSARARGRDWPVDGLWHRQADRRLHLL